MQNFNFNIKKLKDHKIYDKDYEFTCIFNWLWKEYFIYKDIRLTFDKNINYQKLDSLINLKTFDPENVMEIKAKINTSHDYLEEIISLQPLRFSKYSRGILSF